MPKLSFIFIFPINQWKIVYQCKIWTCLWGVFGSKKIHLALYMGPSINDVDNFSRFWHPPPPSRQFLNTICRQFCPIFDPFSIPIVDVVYGLFVFNSFTNFIFSIFSGVAPHQYPELVEYNPVIAYDVLICLMSTNQITDYFSGKYFL